MCCGLVYCMLRFCICELWNVEVSRNEAADVVNGVKKAAPGCMKSYPSTGALCTAESRHKLPDRAASLQINLLEVMVAHSTREDDDRCLQRSLHSTSTVSSRSEESSTVNASRNKDSSEVRC
jgi:hypothetical protein